MGLTMVSAFEGVVDETRGEFFRCENVWRFLLGVSVTVPMSIRMWRKVTLEDRPSRCMAALRNTYGEGTAIWEDLCNA